MHVTSIRPSGRTIGSSNSRLQPVERDAANYITDVAGEGVGVEEWQTPRCWHQRVTGNASPPPNFDGSS